jgi:tetratricopeptide (TPR) repeat protein
MRYRLCRYEEACKDFGAARDLAHSLEDSETEIEVLLDAATALDWADEYRRSKELVDQAQQLSQKVRTPLIESRLLMGLGRSSFRFSQDVEASQLLDQAARCAEPLGDPGYETYVISLLLNGYVLATLGKLAESEEAFERVIPLCTERGDKLHAAGAMLNRLMLWTCRNEKERLLADLHRVLEMAREMGNGRLEQQVHYYLGLYLRWLNECDEAAKHARRAVEIDERRLGEAARPESALLLSRVLAASGDVSGARAILDEIRARQARARDRGDREIELLPGEEAFFSMVDLATRDAEDSEWKELQARAASCLTGQDLLELLEMRSRAAQRQRRPEAAQEALEEALILAERVPNVMKERLKRELESARAAR